MERLSRRRGAIGEPLKLKNSRKPINKKNRKIV